MAFSIQSELNPTLCRCPAKPFHYYLLKLARLSGWLLLPLVIIYIGTGFALCGMLGFSRWMDLQTALAIHQIFDWPLVALFLVHADHHVLLRHAEVGMDQEPQEGLPRRLSRREALKFGLGGLACAACGGAGIYYVAQRLRSAGSADVFKGDAPAGELWELWQKQGWVREARHYLQLGRNIQCKLCPNECLLEPEDRSHCRNRVNKDGKLYTLAYANPCALHVDPIEKKPLFHFLPGTGVFSIATAGCGLRCLNCQNWDISQRKPEETKDPRGEPLRLTAVAVLQAIERRATSST